MANYNHVTPETSTILGPSSIQTETGHIGNYSSKRYDYEETYDYSLKHPQYDTIAERIKSFKNWQYNEKQHYRNLIPAGFFYTGNSDIVRCFCCDIGLAEWDEEDEPWVEHARHSPNCKFLKEKKGEPFINEVQAEWRKIYNPKHPAYMELDTRLNSFQGWPEHLTQRPEDLALAGFFYTGEGDVVRCHYCDGGLREWDPEDTPWTEHAKWFPFCKYIMKVKGISFIEQVGREHEEAEIAANEVSNYTPTITSNNTNNHNIPLSGATEVLFNMGYSRNVVQHIVNIFVERNGHSNYGAEGLVQILLELEERGEVIPTNPPTSQGPRPPRGINNSPSIAAASVLNSNKEEEKKLDPVHIEQENKQLKNNMICVKCKSNERNMVFIPCGHRLMCERCAETENRCTKCNKKVKRRVKTYLV